MLQQSESSTGATQKLGQLLNQEPKEKKMDGFQTREKRVIAITHSIK